MWDVPGGGLPLEPLNVAMREIGVVDGGPPGSAASTEKRMREVWTENGLTGIETRVIRIRVHYAGFDDFWNSNSAPVGPAGQALAKLPPDKKEQLKAILRKQLPQTADGSIGYEAFANAVKGFRLA
jgi:hypothetical protein